jgi:hypothetical protein
MAGPQPVLIIIVSAVPSVSVNAAGTACACDCTLDKSYYGSDRIVRRRNSAVIALTNAATPKCETSTDEAGGLHPTV